MKGQVPTLEPKLSGDFATLMGWADATRRMKIRTNAETPQDAQNARHFGAEGIGLCRTEHMFFDPSRIQKVREMIFAESADERAKALSYLLPEQRTDFKSLFSIMAGLPVTVRLLDPPLHEFLPHEEADIEAFAKEAGIDATHVRKRLASLHESNPMLGHRGCRLGMTTPEIYEMQVRAILEGALEAASETKEAVLPEIMIPLVAFETELATLKAMTERVATEVFAEKGKSIDYLIGTMIELPRAALMADHLATHASFFSFGTNDLTQTTLGLSRDDAGSFLPTYVEKSYLPGDPFVSIDREGVGQLITMACERGRATRSDIKLGICGEHGGDPASIAFCEEVGLAYVSCSPFRVPIARLAAAQATLRMKGTDKAKKAA
jgi:pyruvate,orthophosphate dikinase